MRNKVIILILGMTLLLSLSRLAKASQFSTVSFRYGYIGGSLEFPEEAQPTDTIAYNLTIVAYDDVNVFNFSLKISGLVGEEWQTLHTEQIPPRSMAIGENLTRQIIITLPLNTSERLYCVIEASTDKGSGKTAFYATYVRTITYNELLNLYNELLVNYSTLQDDYNQLLTDYDALNLTYSSLLAEYATLQTNYNSLNSSYSTLQDDYDQLLTNYDALNLTYSSLVAEYGTMQTNYDSLNSSYESLVASYNLLMSNYTSLQEFYTYIKTKYDASIGELNIVRNLMYIFIITTVIFVATTVYLRKKAPYIILRKETAVKPDKE